MLKKMMIDDSNADHPDTVWIQCGIATGWLDMTGIERTVENVM
uniref:Uncharacterized protein n=1 Tax=Candidozyma auris TaxID=498019 RepID=A0A0L0NUF5_CANAR